MALEVANERRLTVAALKRDVRAGRVTLAAIMAHPPAAALDVALVDLVRWARDATRTRAWFERLGKQAVRDDINLLLTVAQASTETRRWLVLHAGWHQHNRKAAA